MAHVDNSLSTRNLEYSLRRFHDFTITSDKKTLLNELETGRENFCSSFCKDLAALGPLAMISNCSYYYVTILSMVTPPPTSAAKSISHYLKNFAQKVIAFHQLQTNSKVTTEPFTTDITSAASQSELETKKAISKKKKTKMMLVSHLIGCKNSVLAF